MLIKNRLLQVIVKDRTRNHMIELGNALKSKVASENSRN